MTSIQAGNDTKQADPYSQPIQALHPSRTFQTTTTGSLPKDKLLELVEPRSQCAGQLRCALLRLRASRAHRADGSGRRAATTAYSTSPPQAHSQMWAAAVESLGRCARQGRRLGAVPRTVNPGAPQQTPDPVVPDFVVPQTGYDECRLTATTDSQSSPGTLMGTGTGSRGPGRVGEPWGCGARTAPRLERSASPAVWQ